MPSEASFSLVRSISEMTSPRRAESGRPEGDGENARPETFGALVSEAVQARNAERKNTPPVETPQEPVDPRPAPERRPGTEARAERANPRRSEEGDTHYNDEKAPQTAARSDKTGTAAGSDETPACKGGCKEEKAEGAVDAATEAAGETAVAEPAKTETTPNVTVAAAVNAVVLESAETTAEGAVGGVTVAVGSVDKTGGTMVAEAETPIPVADLVAEETAGPVVAAAESGKNPTVKAASETTASDTIDVEVSTATTGKAGDAAPADLAIRASTTGAKEAGGGKPEAAIEKIKAEVAEGEGETASGKSVETGKKAAAPDLGPTRLNRVADMLESFGLSNAIHRPADILAGLDRAVQASAVNGAASRAAEVARATPLQMLPIEIGMQAVRGVTNFQIRLDPAELGRVDVKLQIRDNGEVNASLVVDRVETLAMLKRDASTLQQAFEQAGLRQSADGLSFSLRGEGQNGEARREGTRGPAGETADDNQLQPQVAEMAMRRAYVPNSNLDLMI